MKLIAIDGNSLMHRAYYALPNMTNKAGTPTVKQAAATI